MAEHQVRVSIEVGGASRAERGPLIRGDGIRAILRAAADMLDKDFAAAARRETTASVEGATAHITLSDIDYEDVGDDDPDAHLPLTRRYSLGLAVRVGPRIPVG